MALLVGAVLAFLAGQLGSRTGMDRDRAYYPVATIVIGYLYVLFAAMGASTGVLLIEALVGTVFLVAAVLGFRSSLWIVVVALAGHGVLDAVHGALIANPGVPRFWPDFCLAYDVAAAAYLAWRLKVGGIRTAPA